MSFKHIVLARSEGIATLTFNRPDKLNAMNQEMTGELRQALEEVARDPAVRVLIFQGEGRAFMAGADVHTFLGATPLSIRRFIERAHDFLFRLEALEIPVIAAVHGFALGAGFEIALACDFIYAAETAKLGLPETSLGIIPGRGGLPAPDPAGGAGPRQGDHHDRPHGGRRRGPDRGHRGPGVSG